MKKVNLKLVKVNIEADKNLMKNINKLSHFSVEYFIQNALRYIKACEEGRLMCVIQSVSASGMSRNMKFLELNATKAANYKKQYCVFNFYQLFKALGYTPAKYDGFRINGCGMDMVFAVNYNIIHHFHRLGLITKIEYDYLAQQTPHKI